MAEMVQGGTQGAIRRAIVIGNGFAGAENQSIGLVRALGLSDRHSIYRVTRPRGGINRWLPWLPLSLHKKVDYVISGMPFYAEKIGLSSGVVEADAKQIANMARNTFDKDGPLLVVASGRDTIPVASAIKRLAPENVFLVQKQIPWFLRRWITPREPPGKNVVLTIGALHQADPAALTRAASAWHAELAPLPKPLLVVNIGGPSGNCSYGVDLAKQLAAMLQNVLWSCGSVRISFSRRTPEKVSRLLIREFSNNPKVYIWDGEGCNPHMGHLALADAFMITADSVSMLSEACSTGKPVYVIGAEHCTWKFTDFQNRLEERGVVRPFTGKEDMSKCWTYVPLNDTAEAASQVIKALAERGWSILI
ncbi:mitochondrial fission protein ELM1 isoform X3 [Rosa chinensis]|uniref:mitochondrial fission protein ELM1 isoform X3 n=1 Tax=Rosa chinensis TaxID=74649 RepID=UPI000D08847F|nr:mitochondrial fission protein ELM1 isoform X3 [Rosa chinensis]